MTLASSIDPRLDLGSALVLWRLRMGTLALLLVCAVLAWGLGFGLSPAAATFTACWAAIVVMQRRSTTGAPRAEQIQSLVFHWLTLDACCIAVFIGFAGGVFWSGSLLYSIFAVAAASILPARRVLALGLIALTALCVVLGLQLTGTLPSSRFLDAPPIVGAWRSAIFGLLMLGVATTTLAAGQLKLTMMLRDRAIRYRALMDTASDLVVVLAHDGRVTHANRATLAMAQCERKVLRKDGISRLLIADDVALFRNRVQRAVAGETHTMMLRAQSVAGIRWLACTAAPMAPGLPTTDVLAIFRDVTDDRLAASGVRHSEARLRAVFNQAAIAIALLDFDGFFTEVNPAVERLLGYDGAALIGRSWNRFAPPDDLERTAKMIATLRQGGGDDMTVEQRFVRRDGRVLWTLLTLSRVENPTGSAGLIAMVQDITERRALEAQLTWQAYHDPLTNLANRALFRERVNLALQARGDTPGTVAVLFLDLDNFKTINDSMGHAAGDQLLFDVGRRLLNATRGCDTVARLGGDEFAVLIDNVRVASDCIRVAERILHAMQQPVQLEGTEVIVSTSIGIVRDAGTESADDILRNADVAMYNAKQRGKGRHSLFESGMHDKAVERLRLQNDLRIAIENDEITLVFQPIVTLDDGMPCGFETLARWMHPEFGPISPATFIPLAEESGMIVALGATILRLACREAVQWNAIRGLPHPIGLTVNLSGRQVEETAVVSHVRDALMVTGLDPARLTLEITESALVHNSDSIRERLCQLKELGLSLAIDDFGTGYSSLSYIQQFPVDVLKIDRSFVEGLGRPTGTDAALARTIIALGASLHLRTVAEGIEVDAQRVFLRELGCEYGQGYLYAKPMLGSDVSRWLCDTLGIARPGVPPTGVPQRPRTTTPATPALSLSA